MFHFLGYGLKIQIEEEIPPTQINLSEATEEPDAYADTAVSSNLNRE